MPYSIALPNIQISYSSTLQLSRELLLVGGGREPADDWLRDVAANREIWCIDKGIDICYQLKALPKYLAGDFDSCHLESLTWATKKGSIIDAFNRDKDFTDTQAVLDKAKAANAYTILTGALGKRFDHTLSTILSFAHHRLPGCIVDEQESIFFLYPEESITLTMVNPPKAISLFPLTAQVQGVTTQGLKWELTKAELTQTNPYAISNEQKNNDKITISLETGILAIYICHKETGL